MGSGSEFINGSCHKPPCLTLRAADFASLRSLAADATVRPLFMTSCIFCGSHDTSREHVWPQWVSAVLAERASFRVIAEQVAVRTWEQDSADVPLVTKRVCADCNSGWMSRLETAVRPILEPMLRGTRVTVPAAGQQLLARWIVKTAMVLEHTGAAVRKKFFLQTEHSDVRADARLPSNSFIWLAHVADPSLAAWASEDDFTFRFDDHPSAESGVGYTSTFAAGAFAFQLLCLRPHPLISPSTELDFTNEAGWEGYSVRIWPVLDPVAWPPARALDHQRLILYGSRFASGA